MAASLTSGRKARDRPRLRRGPAAFQLLVALVCAGFGYAPDSWAQGRFDIRSAYVEPAEGVYQLNATLDFEVCRRRARRDARRRAAHAPSGDRGPPRALVLARRSGRDARAALRAGLSRAQRTLSGAQPQQRRASLLRDARRRARLVARDQQPADPRSGAGPARARHEISVRASLDVRTMPDTLRFVLFWADDWRQRSEWYTWSPQL